MASKLGVIAQYRSILVRWADHEGTRFGREFDTVEAAEAYMDEHGLFITGDDGLDFHVSEWPEGLWLIVNALSRDTLMQDWQGEGWYAFTWSDNGQEWEPCWFETFDGFARECSSAWAAATEFHLPVCSYMGDGEQPEEE